MGDSRGTSRQLSDRPSTLCRARSPQVSCNTDIGLGMIDLSEGSLAERFRFEETGNNEQDSLIFLHFVLFSCHPKKSKYKPAIYPISSNRFICWLLRLNSAAVAVVRVVLTEVTHLLSIEIIRSH